MYCNDGDSFLQVGCLVAQALSVSRQNTGHTPRHGALQPAVELKPNFLHTHSLGTFNLTINHHDPSQSINR